MVLAAVLKATAAALGFFLSTCELMSFPPEILLFGHRFSQDTKWFREGHLERSVPVSESISRAAISLIPGMSITSTPRMACRYFLMSIWGCFRVFAFFLQDQPVRFRAMVSSWGKHPKHVRSADRITLSGIAGAYRYHRTV